MKKLKKMLTLLLCLCALLPALSCAESNEEILQNFVLKHGDRNEKKICITIDDCYVARRDNIVRDVELCNQYGIHMTFFPIVKTGCLSEKYRDIWQSVLDAGCEIGCHGYQHLHLGSFDYWTLLKRLGRWQEELDKTLGYHYQTRWLRPPYGSISGGKKLNETKLTSALKRFGFDHVIHWDVSETHADQALEKVQNGSIMLFHANHKDTKCLEEIIPVLLEQGYEFVTLSEMFGFDPPETSDELYVYDRANYEKE